MLRTDELENQTNMVFTKEEKNKITDFLYEQIHGIVFLIIIFLFLPSLISLIWGINIFMTFLCIIGFNVILIYLYFIPKIKKYEDSIIELFKSIIEYYGYNSNLYINILLGKEKYLNTIMKLKDISIDTEKINKLFTDLAFKKIINDFSNEYLIENFIKEEFLLGSTTNFKNIKKIRLENEIRKVEKNVKTKNIITFLQKAESDTIKINENVYVKY